MLITYAKMIGKRECENQYIDCILSILNKELDDRYHFLVARANNKHEVFEIEKSIKSNLINILILKSDERGIVPPFLDRFLAVFRQFNTSHSCDNRKIFPIPCGYASDFEYSYNSDHYDPPLDIVPLNKREYDLFFSGQLCGDNRKSMKKALDLICKKFKCCICYTDGYAKGFTLKEYNKKMLSSKISLVPKGATGYDGESMRYFESFRAGCTVITSYDFTDPLYSHWYYKGSPAVIVNNWSELDENIIDRLLQEDILDSSFTKSLKYFNDMISPDSVASYMKSTIQQLSSIES